MAKKKKTRQDKIKADLRHELPQSPLYVVSQATEKIEKVMPRSGTQILKTETYFTGDFKKTAYLTFAVLAGQISLFYFLKNHIIKLPFITY